ncbi:MAG TPA: tRNA lysidine(34) synthetase TilS [Acidimicrobiia bacterium]|nr:tRNA lysidine(34) synthetase TilS [Acidimicrobiia bacterium]
MTPETLRRRIAGRVPTGPATVALSGGADSATLAWAVADREDTTAVTIDHGLPGSAALVTAAQQIAAHLGLEHRVVAVQPRSSSEGDLRTVRLAALEESTAGWILTGHTADDHAETVLGNLLRGSGTAGLAGIPARHRRFVRPLLDVTRAETRTTAGVLGLPYVDDPQNDDPAVRRNRLRNETIPALAASYNPQLRQALLRTAAAAADDGVLEARAAEVPIRIDEEAVLIPAAALTGLPAAVAARLARRALRHLSGDHAGDAAAVAGVLAAASGAGVATLSGGLRARREGPWVAVAGSPPRVPDPVTLPIPGEVPFGSWRISAGAGPVAVPLHGPPVVRASRPGDRIAIDGGHKAVAEALREGGVPQRLRLRWPVVEDGGRIAWVVGIRVAPRESGPVVAMAARREQR